MPQIASHEQVREKRTWREVEEGRHKVWRTGFIEAAKEQADLPQAFMIESTPGRTLGTHFHEVDQFQVVVRGTGTLAKHQLAPYGIHFARAFTPYGAIKNGADGLAFMTLRAHRDPGRAQFIPERRARLDEIADRKPWQVTAMAEFATSAGEGSLQEIPGMKDENGLSAWTLSLGPRAEKVLPAVAKSDGQYVVVLEGALRADGAEHKGLSVVFVRPDEPAFRLVAGEEGLKAVVLNFPVPTHHAKAAAGHYGAAQSAGAGVWSCSLCDFKYDEAKGLPEHGIAPGTKWADVPAHFTCPDCEADKDGFSRD